MFDSEFFADWLPLIWADYLRVHGLDAEQAGQWVTLWDGTRVEIVGGAWAETWIALHLAKGSVVVVPFEAIARIEVERREEEGPRYVGFSPARSASETRSAN